MSNKEEILKVLVQELGEDLVKNLSPEELQFFLENPPEDVITSNTSSDFNISNDVPLTKDEALAVNVSDLEIKKDVPTATKEEPTPPAPRGFEDFCPDIMKNEKTARWIEQEGDKAKVFAVKMAGLKDNPLVSPQVKKVISTPEGMVAMYNQVDAKAKEVETLCAHAMETNRLEDIQKFEKVAYENRVYSDLMRNDTILLDAEHWEKCYRTTSQTEKNADKEFLQIIEAEARIYEEKQKLQARKGVLNNMGATSKEQDKPNNMTVSTKEKTSSKKGINFSQTYKVGRTIKDRQSRA